MDQAIDALAECGALNAALETEHHAIECLLNVFRDAVLAGANSSVIIRILDMVIDFFSAHFRHEEAFFRDHGYREIERHVAAHELFQTKLRNIRAGVEDEGTALAVLDGVDLLHDFLEHVGKYDSAAYEQIAKIASHSSTLRGTKRDETENPSRCA